MILNPITLVKEVVSSYSVYRKRSLALSVGFIIALLTIIIFVIPMPILKEIGHWILAIITVTGTLVFVFIFALALSESIRQVFYFIYDVIMYYQNKRHAKD